MSDKRRAVSFSEYRRLKAQGADVEPPEMSKGRALLTKVVNQMLSHEERQRLIHAPMPIVDLHQGKSHGGTIVHHHVPDRGQRNWVPDPWDEEAYKIARED